MSYEKLTSEKVNYLIWRYLQEAGFAQAAARLQQDWGLQHHPDDLPFAKHIGPRALIKLLHYGLKLHRIQTSDKSNAPRFFGPDPDSINTGFASESVNTTIATASITATLEGSRPKSPSPLPLRRFEGTTIKTTATQTISSAPLTASKPRNRKSNGFPNGKPKDVVIGDESMDVDQTGYIRQHDNNDMEIDGEDTNESKVPIAESIPSTSSSARNGEYQQPQPPQPVVNGLELHGLNHQIQEAQITVAPIPTPTLINGISVGIQSDKVIELSPFTRLISTSSVKQSALNHAAWNGSDAYISTFETALLAIGGKELGQIWEINKMEIRGGELGTLNNPSPDHHYSRKVIHPQSIIDLDVGPTKTLVSLAWSPDAGKLAYSTFSDDVEGPRRSVIRTRMRLPDTDGDTYTTVPEAVTNLVWNKTGRYIAGLSSMSVIILDTRTGTQFKPLNIEHTLFDAAWLDSETLVICGDSTITIATLSGGSISMSHTFRELAGSTEWTKLRYNNTLNSFAIVSETSGDLAVVQARGKTYKEVCAHSPGIIDLAYEGYPNEDQGSLLVTSAADGSVKVWNLGSGISLVQTLAMGGVSQALSLSFSPDHKLLAVADWDKVLFWDIRQATQPKYKWELRRMDWQSLQNGHKPNGVHHDHDMNMTETDDGAPILLWDGLSSMLTFVHKDKIAMINLPPGPL